MNVSILDSLCTLSSGDLFSASVDSNGEDDEGLNRDTLEDDFVFI